MTSYFWKYFKTLRGNHHKMTAPKVLQIRRIAMQRYEMFSKYL
nr:MAG TPA: hypothetical protein [Caudoviricetes sp.]